MEKNIIQESDHFPRIVQSRLDRLPVDFFDRHNAIVKTRAEGNAHSEAGIAVLLLYKENEFVFQLIRRSGSVAQGGDISCPGGLLDASTDDLLRHLLNKTDMICGYDGRSLARFSGKDNDTSDLIRLFLMNALRESWEEIGLSPLNVNFLGVLPSYSLTYFARTIFPVVCLVREAYAYRLSSEVEKVLEVPLSFFFDRSFYAQVEIDSALSGDMPQYSAKFPCLVIPGQGPDEDILWGATFKILTHFLEIISDGAFAVPSGISRVVQKTLQSNYAPGKSSRL